MKKKLMYEVPDAELIELKLDSNQMQGGSPVYGNNGEAGSELEDGGTYNL